MLSIIAATLRPVLIHFLSILINAALGRMLSYKGTILNSERIQYEEKTVGILVLSVLTVSCYTVRQTIRENPRTAS
jgi:hypothetical protein